LCRWFQERSKKAKVKSKKAKVKANTFAGLQLFQDSCIFLRSNSAISKLFTFYFCLFTLIADVAESVDAKVSEAFGSNLVEVQVFSSAFT
jgi:hypothetical protein